MIKYPIDIFLHLQFRLRSENTAKFSYPFTSLYNLALSALILQRPWQSVWNHHGCGELGGECGEDPKGTVRVRSFNIYHFWIFWLNVFTIYYSWNIQKLHVFGETCNFLPFDVST